MYMTLVHASPCTKMGAPRGYATPFGAMPAEFRNACALNCRGDFDSMSESWQGESRSAVQNGTGLFGPVEQDDAEQGGVDFEAAVVFDETQLPEFVHEKVHTRS